MSTARQQQESIKLELPLWARAEFEAWQKAKNDTAEIQRLYNELLTAVDDALKLPPFDQHAQQIRKLQHDLNTLYRLDGIFRQDTGAKYSKRWFLLRLSPMFWLRKLSASILRPLISHQQ